MKHIRRYDRDRDILISIVELVRVKKQRKGRSHAYLSMQIRDALGRKSRLGFVPICVCAYDDDALVGR